MSSHAAVKTGTAGRAPHIEANARAEKFLLQGDMTQALKWLDVAAKLEPSDPVTQYMRGRCYEGQLNDGKAIEYFTLAVELNKKHGGQVNAALKLESPIDGHVYVERARVYDRLHEFEKSVADLTRAIAVEPRAAKHRLVDRAREHMALLQFDLAIKDCSAAIAAGNRANDPYQLRGESYAALKKFPAALADLDAASKREEMGTAALSKKAEVFDAMGNHASAAKLRAQIKAEQADLGPGNYKGY